MLRRFLSRVMANSHHPIRRRALQRDSQLNWTPGCELLETRQMLSATNPLDDLIAQPLYVNSTVTPLGSVGPVGYTPAQIRHAYGFDSITFANGTIQGDGSGTTIAIVDAYDDPNIASDLHKFNLQFGLPDSTFTKVNQNGGTTLPTADTGWAQEIALDVEWAHAIAPKANILLVEAVDASINNLMAAVDYARQYAGVVAISMSWGCTEFSGENTLNSHFTTPAGHQGVTFVASSGDWGAPVEFPAISPNVVGVGGTALTVSSTGTYMSETGWSGSGGGISAYQAKPAYQNGVVTQSSTYRASPDVAYDSSPNTGFAVYDSYSNSASAPWSKVGGTSAAAPQWAGLIAIADQGRSLAGLGTLDGATQTLPKIYSLASSDFHDVTTGSSTGSPTYSATVGYDLVTGRGTPIANLVVSDFVGVSSSTPAAAATHFSVTASSTATAGSAFSVTVTALDASNNVLPGYVGTVHFSSTDTAGILPSNYTFTTADNGVHTFSGVVLKTAGVQTIKVNDTANSSILGNTTVTVNAAAASRLVFSQQPSNVAGSLISPAVKVQIVDAYNNLLKQDNSDVVTISLGSNPTAAVLSGTLSATVSGGVATFSSLSINKLGNGYTLVAKSGTLSPVTSLSFNVVSATKLIEGFESGNLYNYYRVGGSSATVALSSYTHDGYFSLRDYSGSDWIYRNDSTVQVKQGDTISVWTQFVGNATGVAAFGFGASSLGTLSLVASPVSNQLLLTNNVGFGSTTLAASNQTWQADHWYRLEVTWGTSGQIVGKVFDSNGTTLLQSVTGTTTAIKSGGIAFKANGGSVLWDTVQLTPGVSASARSISLSVDSKHSGSGFGTSASSLVSGVMPNQEVRIAAMTGVGGVSDSCLDAAFGDFAQLANSLDPMDSLKANGPARMKKIKSSQPLVIGGLASQHHKTESHW